VFVWLIRSLSIVSLQLILIGCQMPVSGFDLQSNSDENEIHTDFMGATLENNLDVPLDVETQFILEQEIIVVDIEENKIVTDITEDIFIFEEEKLILDEELLFDLNEIDKNTEEVLITKSELINDSSNEILIAITQLNQEDSINYINKQEITASADLVFEDVSYDHEAQDIIKEEIDEDAQRIVGITILPPIANSDKFSVHQSKLTHLNLLENDTNIESDVQISIVSPAKSGLVEILGDGKVQYFPDQFYIGKDEFVYKIANQNGDASIASVTLTIECVLDCTKTFKLSWDESLSDDIVGYNVYMGRNSEELKTVFEVANVTQFDYLAEERGDYYFAVAAVNFQGVESKLTEYVYGTF